MDPGLVARFGVSVATRGGKIARNLQWLKEQVDMFRQATTNNAFIERNWGPPIRTLLAQLASAIYKNDSALFEEVARFLRAAARCDTKGALAPAWSCAAAYIYICQHGNELKNVHDLSANFSKVPTLADALKRSPFVPTVADIYDHLCATFDPAPDYKTVLGIAKALRIRSRKKRQSKK